MSRTRRSFLVGIGTATVGAAIGRSAMAAQSTPVSETVAAVDRPVSHAMGETRVPASPKRVVALDGAVLDACILLGVPPVGATTGVENDPWPAYLGEGTDDIVNVGSIVEPNLELIVTLQPDLIIGVRSRHEAIYPQLSAIAPTVFAEQHRSQWRENFLLVAKALNREDQVDGVVSNFDDRCASVAAQLGDQFETTTVSVLRVYTDTIYAYQVDSFSGSVLDAIGLKRPESQSGPEELAIDLSPEQLATGDGDVIFLTVWGDPATTDVSTLVTNPLWDRLEAVRANRVFLVPDEYWMVAMGYIAANRILDDVVAYLIDDKEPTELPAS